VDTFGALILVPAYSTTALGAEMCTNSHEHSMHIRFLCLQYCNVSYGHEKFYCTRPLSVCLTAKDFKKNRFLLAKLKRIEGALVCTIKVLRL